MPATAFRLSVCEVPSTLIAKRIGVLAACVSTRTNLIVPTTVGPLAVPASTYGPSTAAENVTDAIVTPILANPWVFTIPVARATGIVNTQGFARIGVTIASVTFSAAVDGPYVDAGTAKGPTVVGTIKFVRVETQAASTPILFAINVLGTSQTESRNAVAGMSVGINGFCDYFPIAIAKTDPTVSYPVNAPIVAKFKDNTGTTINLPDGFFVVLDTPWVTGNGAEETRDAVAGIAPRCAKLNDVLNFSKSPSANAVNGPKQVEDGANTRFYIYPPGNQLTYDNAKPASNVFGANPGETITFHDYDSANPATFTAPGQTGVFERRLLLLPIIDPIVNGPPNGPVKKFGYFFLRQAVDGDCPRKVKGVNVPCPPGTTAAAGILP